MSNETTKKNSVLTSFQSWRCTIPLGLHLPQTDKVTAFLIFDIKEFTRTIPQNFQKIPSRIRIRSDDIHGFSGLNIPEGLRDLKQGQRDDQTS